MSSLLRRLWFVSGDGTEIDIDDPYEGIHVRHLEGTGIPAAIHQTSVSPNRDGDLYLDTFIDVRYLTIEIVWDWQGRNPGYFHVWRRTLSRVLNPKNGPGWLYYWPSEVEPIYKISAVLDGTLPFGRFSGQGVEMGTLPLRCPNPYWMSTEERSNLAVGSGGSPAVEGGLTIPMDIPFSIVGGSGGGGSSENAATVSNDGDVDVYPTVLITGSATGPSVTNLTTGKTVALPGLAITGQQVVRIDMDAKTITRDGADVWSFFQPGSEMWALRPGVNDLQFDTESGAITVTLLWHDRFIGI